MGLLWTLWEIGVNCLENAFFILLLIGRLGYSTEKKKYVFLCYIGLVTVETFMNFNNFSNLLTVLILLFCYIISAIFVFDKSLPKRILWGCSGAIIAQVCNMLTFNLFSVFGYVNLLDSQAPTQTRFEMMICYIFLYALVYFVLVHIRPDRKIFLKWPLRIVVIAIFIVGIFAIQEIIDIYYLLSGMGSGQALGVIDHNLITISAIIIGTFLGIMFLFEYIGSLAQKNIEALTELQQTKLENAQLKHVSDTYQALRAWKHDYQNHLDLIHTYLEQGKLDELKKYISEIKAETGPFMYLYYTGHSVIDAVLSNKLFIAHSKGIEIKSNVVLPAALNIPDSQLCSVLSNLLDNAIEAQDGISQPFIYIKIHQERGMLYIKIENGSSGKYLYKQNQLISIKKSEDHGIGLRQVKKIVENLRGIINIEPQPETFMVQILIPTDLEGVHIA
jgi:Signal transduction histidine kinase regulating citrate/malate metabolism